MTTVVRSAEPTLPPCGGDVAKGDRGGTSISAPTPPLSASADISPARGENGAFSPTPHNPAQTSSTAVLVAATIWSASASVRQSGGA